MTREWKPVIGFEGLYEVSNLGEVRGMVRSGCTGEILRGFIDKGGYKVVTLYNHQKHKHMKVHRIVAMAFIENNEHKRTVNHIDGNKLNNRVENLEWATHSENHRHAYRTGLKKPTEKQRKAASETGKRTCETNRPKRPVYLFDNNGSKKWFESAHEGARFVGGQASAIIRVCKGKQATHKGYRWEYAS